MLQTATVTLKLSSLDILRRNDEKYQKLVRQLLSCVYPENQDGVIAGYDIEKLKSIAKDIYENEHD